MLKKTLFVGVPVLLLIGAFFAYRLLTNDNDSPIVVTDTTSPLTGQPTALTATASTAGTKINRENVRYWNKHFHQKPNTKLYHVHDIQLVLDTYKAGCFEFPSGKVPVPSSATTWKIVFEGSNGPLFRIVWNGGESANARDIAIRPEFDSSANDTILTNAYQVTMMKWSIDGGQPTPETAVAGRQLVKIDYCPGGTCAVGCP